MLALLGHDFTRRLGLRLNLFERNFGGRAPAEGTLARHHFVEHDTQRIEIRALIERLILTLFRRGVGDSAAQDRMLGEGWCARRLRELGNAEVN